MGSGRGWVKGRSAALEIDLHMAVLHGMAECMEERGRAENTQRLCQRLQETILGAEEPARLLTLCLMAAGHALIEGPPGIGKTSMAQALAKGVGGNFRRVQFTPDLLPSDLLGFNVYEQQSGEFRFIPGPVFSHFLLADEINRTSPRIQSALLECMNEGQVTIDGTSYELERPFMVVATRNDAFATGTFPLPEPQLDRFLFSIPMVLPPRATQVEVLGLHLDNPTGNGSGGAVLESAEVLELQQRVAAHPVSEAVREYVVRLCEAARRESGESDRVSVRASLALLRASQAAAVFAGHDAVHPDDVKSVVAPVLRHRLEGVADHAALGQMMEDIVTSVDVP